MRAFTGVNPKSDAIASDALPTAEELKLVGKLQEEFKDEFVRRKKDGRDFPCFFGDIALARVLRGNGGELESAITWFRRFLEKAEKFHLDEMVLEMTRKLDESKSQFGDVTMLPHHEEFTSLFRTVFTAPALTPRGDVIQYVPVIDFDKKGILSEADWDHWVLFYRSMMVLRCIELERLSRAKGRIVRVLTIVDMDGSSMDTLFFKPFDDEHETAVSQFGQMCTIEIMGPVYVVNPSWTISTGWTMLKRFAPKNFMNKVQFVSGDGLADSSFVELAGGQTQLRELYETRQGLTLQREDDDGEAFDSDVLATEREQEMISRLRDEFQEQLEKRSAEGRDYPFFFGDIALTRVLRGNDGSYRRAMRWFKRFLDRMDSEEVDEMIKDVQRRLKESGNRFGDLSILRYYDEVKDYIHLVASAPKPTSKGDMLQYMAICDLNRKGVLENLTWEHWVHFLRSMMVLRVMHCDHLSRQQGRVAKCVSIWDLSGTPLDALRVPEYDEPHRSDISSFMEHHCIEIVGTQYVVNGPWFLVRLFNMFNGILPERLTRKFKMIDGDGQDDAEFTELVGGSLQLQQLLSSRVGLCQGLKDTPSGEREIAAGSSFDKFQPVRAGQRLNFSFELIAGFGDGWLGTSDIEFSGKFFEFPEVTDAVPDPQVVDEAGQEIVSPQMCDSQEGEVKGYYDAVKSGIVVLRFNNEHSMMRAKTLRYALEVAS